MITDDKILNLCHTNVARYAHKLKDQIRYTNIRKELNMLILDNNIMNN
jgi:hypothetical protein